jgi:hypothetical protein
VWLAVILVATLPGTAWAWGDATHRRITELALETLPAPLAAEFSGQRTALVATSLEPDTVLRERLGEVEKVRHYINLDAYMPPPFRGFPHSRAAAIGRVGAAKAERYGSLPWEIVQLVDELRGQRRRGGGAWVRIAGHLAHYVADAYQPLHLTVNFDGQRSGARGLHRRFEDRLVDARLTRYSAAARALLKPAQRLDDVNAAVFAALFASYGGVERIVAADAAAARRHGRRGKAYYDAFAAALEPLCQEQIAAAASMLGTLWLTAEPPR